MKTMTALSDASKGKCYISLYHRLLYIKMSLNHLARYY